VAGDNLLSHEVNALSGFISGVGIDCPSGTVPVGGGASFNGGAGVFTSGLFIQSSNFTTDHRGWIAQAVNNTWTDYPLTVSVTCIYTPAAAAAASASGATPKTTLSVRPLKG
jgi:hypothetical protein